MTGESGSILVVEDDSQIRRATATGLERAGYDVVQAATVVEAKRAVATSAIALVILDIGMPDGSGLDLLRALDRPVIIISGHTSEADRVVGLELGADDYVSKPFSQRELLARVRCVLRRASTGVSDIDAVLSFPGLVIDPGSREVLACGELVDLTRKEFDLLSWLAAHPRHVFSKSHLLESVWSCEGEWTSEATVTEHIRRLRQKLAADGDGGGPTIATVWGVGYRFDPTPEEIEPPGARPAAQSDARV
jgi:two-component system phosphate regulon response regulator PhoB